MNWYNGLCWLFVCGVLALWLAPTYGYTIRTQDTCDCSSTCAPRIKISNSGGGMTEDCPECPEPMQPTCPTSTCPWCPTCPPPIPTTTTEEPPSTTTPDPGPCPRGYETVTGIINKCYMIVETFKTAEASTDALCDGGSILVLDSQDELDRVTQWAWTKLGSGHISFWASGKYVTDLAPAKSVGDPQSFVSGDFLWGDGVNIVLASFQWHTSQPLQQANSCIKVSVTLNKLDHGTCDAEVHYPICQIRFTLPA